MASSAGKKSQKGNQRAKEQLRLEWISGPTSLLKQGHLEPVAQDHAQTAFEYPQEQRPKVFGQPVTVSSPSQLKAFSDAQEEPLLFKALLVACPVTRHHQKKPDFFALLVRFSLSILVSGLHSSVSHSFSLSERCSNLSSPYLPFAGLPPVCLCLPR